VWVGIDDTDSPRGGCTTWALTELVDEARSAGFDLIGEPRLVRLNPNVPWKTRGNAALAARFGVGAGPRRRLGEVGGRPVWSYATSRPATAGLDPEWLSRAWLRVLAASRADEPGTDPAMVATSRALPAELYWNAVREVVDPTHVKRSLERAGAYVRTRGSDRGVVGASAAIAWRGAHPTWELVAYRAPDRGDRRRDVDRESVREAQRRFPALFLCEDSRTRRLLVAPHTHCPILYGLRGTTPGAPLAARHRVRSEPVERWMLFRTNQGSGDHLVARTPSDWTEYRSGSVTGRVDAHPQLLPGGHVRFPVRAEAGGLLECLAFEPTKTLPRVARTLLPGDRVRVWGSRGRDPSVRLEGIELRRLVARTLRPRAPECPECRAHTRSMGRARGFRCPECHRKWPPEAAVVRPDAPAFGRGVYHPTASARRHLAPRAPEL
jgi:tRNA(Ile2)-agmatinylcytidine synthase